MVSKADLHSPMNTSLLLCNSRVFALGNIRATLTRTIKIPPTTLSLFVLSTSATGHFS